MADFLKFEGVTKRFGPLKAVDDVTFGVEKGEFFSLLGPSGCGKTTLLRMLAGKSQRAIARELRMSLCKITRGAKYARDPASPFRRAVLAARRG